MWKKDAFWPFSLKFSHFALKWLKNLKNYSKLVFDMQQWNTCRKLMKNVVNLLLIAKIYFKSLQKCTKIMHKITFVMQHLLESVPKINFLHISSIIFQKSKKIKHLLKIISIVNLHKNWFKMKSLVHLKCIQTNFT